MFVFLNEIPLRQDPQIHRQISPGICEHLQQQ